MQRLPPRSLWTGPHVPASVQAPGVGAGVEPAAQVDRAADDLGEYQRHTLRRLADHDEVLRQLRDRVTALESNVDIDRRLAESRRLGERMERSGQRAVQALRAAADVLRNGNSRPAGRSS